MGKQVREVENYITKKMKRGREYWMRAHKNFEKGKMRTAAINYANAMQMFYECATDLIDGTGFKEENTK